MSSIQNPLGILPSLGSRLAEIRSVVRARALELLDDNERRLGASTENVDLLEGIRFGAAKEEGCDAVAFLCATVGIHVDTDMVPRWNTLVYLGTLEEVPGVHHVLYALDPGGKQMDEVKDGTRPEDIGGTEHVLHLQPGSVVTLDVNRPHWFHASVDGRKIGGSKAKSPMFGKLHSSLRGVDARSITAMFVAVASDIDYVSGERLEKILDSIHVHRKPT